MPSPALPPASDPALPRLASRGRQHAGLRKPTQSPSSGSRAFARSSSPQPRPPPASPALSTPLAQPQYSLAPDPGPDRGPVLGASRSHEAAGCPGPHNAGSRARVPEPPAPGEASPGTEGALQREARAVPDISPQSSVRGPGQQVRAAALSPAGRGHPACRPPGPVRNGSAHPRTGLQSWPRGCAQAGGCGRAGGL